VDTKKTVNRFRKEISMRRLRCLARFTGALFIAISAAASTRAEPAKGPLRSAPTAGYTYAFLDDPLEAGGPGTNEVHIRVASHVIRTTLIRPRTTFVAELLKTVENL
jgi:hypothetical protein